MKAKLLIATAVVIGGIAAPSAQAATAPTQVTIKGPNGDFAGYVQSKDASCEGDRKVVVFKQTGSAPAPRLDQKIGSDVTSPDGSWSTGNSGYKDGDFYARAKRTPFCKAGMSPVINL